MMVLFSVAHVAVGSLAFGAAVALAISCVATRVRKRLVAQGGMVTA